MIGSISKAFVEAIRASQLVADENISVVLANDNGEGTVNTALPAIAVTVKGTERDNGQYIGGLIDNEFIVQLITIVSFDNQAASEDSDFQYDQMDLHYKLMRYIDKIQTGPFFRDLMSAHDFSLSYKGTETEQSRGFHRDVEVEVQVARLVYCCKFLSKEAICERPGAWLPADGICINLEDFQIIPPKPDVPDTNFYLTTEDDKYILTEDGRQIQIQI